MKNNLDHFGINVIIPIKWVLKFDPPIIGLVYKLHIKDKKKHLYQIHLNNLIFLSNPEDIVKQIIHEHPQYLDSRKVKFDQITGLVRKLLDFKSQQWHEMEQILNEEPLVEYEDEESF